MSPSTKPETRSFEVKIEINAPAETVWKAITEAEEIAKWFAPDVRVEPGMGGSIFISWGPGMEGTMTIEAWEPNRHLTLAQYRDKSYGCGAPETADSGEGVTRRIATDYYIESAKGGGTLLRLVHSGFGPGADWDAEIESSSRGWPTFFMVMKHGIERHPGEPASNVTMMAMSGFSPEEAWNRLSGLRNHKELKFGDVLIDGHRHFAAVIANWNDAICSLTCEGQPDSPGAAVYWMVTLYSTPAAGVEEIRTRWSEVLQGLVS